MQRLDLSSLRSVEEFAQQWEGPLDLLVNNAGVMTPPLAHFRGKADAVEGNPEQGYRREPAYANSKLANVLFSRELQKRASEHETRLSSTGAHPGTPRPRPSPAPTPGPSRCVSRVARSAPRS